MTEQTSSDSFNTSSGSSPPEHHEQVTNPDGKQLTRDEVIAAFANVVPFPGTNEVPTDHKPALDITDAEFLNELFTPELSHEALVCGKYWVVSRHSGRPQPTSAEDRYYIVSRFNLNENNKVVRLKEFFIEQPVLVFDDVNEVKKPDDEGNVPPVVSGDIFDRMPPVTYKLNTSAGSEQWGWNLKPPEPEQEEHFISLLEEFHKQFIKVYAGGIDTGQKGVTRAVRLPSSYNMKDKRRNPDGSPFKCYLHEWNPGPRYDLLYLAGMLGLDLSKAKLRNKHDVDHAVWPEDAPLWKALERAGLDWKTGDKEGVYKTQCPNHAQHTDDKGLLSGQIYTYADGTGGYKCHHGHCQELKFPGVLQLLGIKELHDEWRKANFGDALGSGKIDTAEAFKAVPPLAAGMVGLPSLAPVFEWPEPLPLDGDTVLPDLPLEVLPPALANYAADISERGGFDAGMTSMFGLAVIAAAITDEIKIQPKSNDPSWKESARIWVAAVGDPSIKKSPALRSVDTHTKDQNAEWCKENEAKNAVYQEAKADIEADRRAFKKDRRAAKKAGNLDEVTKLNEALDALQEPTKPVMHRAYVSDVTVEKLGDLLQYSPRGVLVHHDELSGLFGGMGNYSSNSGGATKDAANYLELYNGGSQVVDRISRGTILVPNWGASIVGGIQPAALRKAVIKSGLQDNGMFQRFNLIKAKDATAGHNRTRNPEYAADFERLMKAAFELDGEMVFVFSDEAMAVFEAFNAGVRDLEAAKFLSVALRTHLGKWAGQFARYALVLHIGRVLGERGNLRELPAFESGPAPVREIPVSVARDVARLFEDYLLPHAYAVYNEVEDSTEDEEQARVIAKHILAKEFTEITRRDIQRGCRSLRSAGDREVHQAMETLAACGWVEPRSDKFPCSKWVVNPKVHTLFAAQAEKERESREKSKRAIAALTRVRTGKQIPAEGGDS